MSVNSIDTVVLLFPNEEWSTTATDAQLEGVVAQLRPNISFAQHLEKNDLQTLSTNNADEDGEIDGFLYVPDLNRNDPCFNISKNYIPANVTRQANLPPTDFTLIALAPWISVECTKSYLSAAHMDPARAFLFYLPDNGTSQPPPISSPSWGLQDGGAWKSQTPFPVYALSSNVGVQLMHQSSLYSGNMTSVPYGHEISEMLGIDPRDYVRIYAQITLSNGSAWPGLWAFVLVIVGVLVVLLGLTSAAMHVIQRVRRNSLRRRVASGEVNLEALGIKRLTVPQDMIEKLPIFTYSCESVPPSTMSPPPKQNQYTTITERDGSSENSPGSKYITEMQPSEPSAITDSNIIDIPEPPHKFLPYSQPTCAICLDDFEPGKTAIRELPCGHIFHPDCIDSFLGNNSSLCPMCKKSVLPTGYCPTDITPAMVRRERNLRALRSRVTVSDEEVSSNPQLPRNNFRAISSKFRRVVLHSSSVLRSAETSIPLQPEILMTSARPVEVNTHVSILGNAIPASVDSRLSRQEIAQQRIQELTSGHTFVEETEGRTPRQRTRWRRTLAKAFPGFT